MRAAHLLEVEEPLEVLVEVVVEEVGEQAQLNLFWQLL